MWFDLGTELLQQKDIEELQVIKNGVPDLSLRCSNMFMLWLEREPKASWSNLIQALKQIKLNKLAFDIENLLSVGQGSDEMAAVDKDKQQTSRMQESHDLDGMYSYIQVIIMVNIVNNAQPHFHMHSMCLFKILNTK